MKSSSGSPVEGECVPPQNCYENKPCSFRWFAYYVLFVLFCFGYLIFDVSFWKGMGKKLIPKIETKSFPQKKYSKPPFFQRSSLWKPAGLLQNIRIYGLRPARLTIRSARVTFATRSTRSKRMLLKALEEESSCKLRSICGLSQPASRLTERKWKTPIRGQIFQKTNRDVHGMKAFKKGWLIRIMFMGALQKLSSLFFDFSDHTE